MYLNEMLLLENMHFATNFKKLSGLQPKIWQFIHFGSHFGSHLEFCNCKTPEVIFMYLNGMLILENIYFATDFMNLSDLEPKI